MTAICFTVPGKPQGKARARTYYNAKKKAMSSITVQDRDLYEANRAECRKDIEAFNQLVYAAEDERVTGGTADETEK